MFMKKLYDNIHKILIFIIYFFLVVSYTFEHDYLLLYYYWYNIIFNELSISNTFFLYIVVIIQILKFYIMNGIIK